MFSEVEEVQERIKPRKWREGAWRCFLGQISYGPLCSGQEFRLDLEDAIGWEGFMRKNRSWWGDSSVPACC